MRRVLWVACACALLLAPRAEAAGRTLTADFDGDGHSDWVAIDRLQPSVLHIWLSRSGTATQIRRHRPVVQIAAHDVDGDHLPELITAEENGTAGRGWQPAHALRVWRQDARRGFRTYHARPPTPHALNGAGDDTLAGEDPADDCADGVDGFLHAQDSAVARDAVDALCPASRTISNRRADAALASHDPSAPSSPRAPPTPSRR